MATEVWFRNPYLYIRECVELLAGNLAWDRGFARKKGIDPLRHAELHFPRGIDFRVLFVGEQGTAELRPGHPIGAPFAVYPTWVCGDDSLDDLEELMAHPVGESRRACSSLKVPADERPVFGQEHRVVAVRPPAANTAYGKKVYRLLGELQDEYPDCILHVHGTYSYRYAFGLGFRSADVEPRILAKKGKVTLPNGREMTFEKAQERPQWLNVVGFCPQDIEIPRNRCMYNMRSAQWAGEHYTENFNFRLHRIPDVDATSSTATFTHPTTTRSRFRPLRAGLGDQFLCDICSLKDDCKLFRVGGVCTIPGSETTELAGMFGSRDSDKIIDGLSAVLAKQADRAQRAVEREENKDENPKGEIDPEVTRLLNAVFSNGVKMAKLLNPRLVGGGTTVQVGVAAGGQAAVAVSGATPQALMAEVVRTLEEQGIPRDKITPELIERHLTALPAAVDPDEAIDIDEL